jgi:hypothetical protein
MLIEFSGNKVNHAEADLDSDRGNNLTINGSCINLSILREISANMFNSTYVVTAGELREV